MSEVNIKEMIVSELKTQGLEIGEDVAIMIVKLIFGLIPKVVLATESKMDDLLIPVLAVLEPKIMELLDKIDGVESK